MSILLNSLDWHQRWRTRWVLARNRVLGSARFQRGAIRLPLFRSIARRRAAAQFDLIAGFVYSQIAFAFAESGMLAQLRGQLLPLAQIIAASGLSAAASERLLCAARALRLAESPAPGLWTLGQAGAELSANPGALAMIAHHALLYRDLADPLALLTAPGGADGNSLLARFWAYESDSGGGSESTACVAAQDYSKLMAATQPMIFDQIVGRYPFARHRAMLDIGGGSGAFAKAVAQRHPALTIALFDLPQVTALSQEQFAESAGAARITLHAGSFKTDPLPPGYDLMTLVRILHDHDDPVVSVLLAKIYAALPAGGRLLIAEPMAATKGAQAMGDGYFGLYLWAMGSGRPRSSSTYRHMLTEAGFARVRELTTPLPIVCRMLVAEK